MSENNFYIFRKFGKIGGYSKTPRTLKGAASYFKSLKNAYSLEVYDCNFNFKFSVCGYYEVYEFLKRCLGSEKGGF